jgi:PAP2 superfamily protein
VSYGQLTYSAAHADRLNGVGVAVSAAVAESRAFLTAVAIQIFAASVMCAIAHRPMLVGLADSYETFLGAGALVAVMALAVDLFRRRQAIGSMQAKLENYRAAWRSLRSEMLTRGYATNVALVFLVAPLGFSAFSAAKQAIPFIHPFSWDARIAALGAAMHGGTHLWVSLQPIVAHPSVTIVMDWYYHRLWVVLLLCAFAWGALLPPSPLRRQYLLAFVSVFLIVGTLGALALSSAGPAYYARVVGHSSSDPYAPLLSYLHSVNARDGLLSVRGQGGLWYAYTHDVEALGFGISAMPSVHVASATLVALFGFALSRPIGVLLGLIAICTFVVSVALAWHYALDGYVGAILACCIWWFSGLITAERRAERVVAIS